MTTSPLFPGFDGLMTLSRREGVDIRPTLLRVLTDLYVQASSHSADEARQFVELTSRLIDQVDDATRAAVRARLAIYPSTPVEILRRLGLRPAQPGQSVPLAAEITSPTAAAAAPKLPIEPAKLTSSHLWMQPSDAAQLCDMFFRAEGRDRITILHSLNETPLKAAPRIPETRARRAVEALEMAAFVADVESFTIEVGETLILPTRVATQIVGDISGEPLACAMRTLDMPGPVFERVLLFLNPQIGTSVHAVYRLSRLYDRLSERSALVMLAAWRGSTLAVTRAKYRPALHDDERQRARNTSTPSRPAVQPGSAAVARIKG